MRLNKLHISAAFGFVLLTGAFAIPAWARTSSSFQNSCSNATVSGNKLSADCDVGDFWHNTNHSSITLRGIYNNNGALYDDGTNNPASFYQSCQHASYDASKNFEVEADTLFAYCRTKNGNWVHTYGRIDGISNKSGNLSY